MKILLTGGTGFIGSALRKSCKGRHQVTVITRTPQAHVPGMGEEFKSSAWLDEVQDLNDFDAVVNLAGEPIADARWSTSRKHEICESRWQITRRLAELIASSDSPPEVLISGSAIGVYGRQGNKMIDESFADYHQEFSHRVCINWEQLALEVEHNTRVCILRTGIVLGKNGGALQKMLLPFKLGLGGTLASGEQMMSWIHLHDMVAAIMFLLENRDQKGVYNLTAPNPVTNREFTQALGQALHRPTLLNTPGFALRLLFGEMADLLIYGQVVVPTRLLDAGFVFQYPQVSDALVEVVEEK